MRRGESDLANGGTTNVSKEKAQMDFRTPMNRARRGMLVTLAATVALGLCLLAAPSAGANSLDFGLTGTSTSVSTEQAGAHPDFETRFLINGNPTEPSAAGQRISWARARNAVTELPPGLLGNPSAFPTCSTRTFMEQIEGLEEAVQKFFNGITWEMCPTDTQVGTISPGLAGIIGFPPGTINEPLYNLEAPGGDSHIVARLGFVALFYPVFIDVRLDPKRDNALTATVSNINALVGLTGSYNRFWGVPTDESHDLERVNWVEALFCGGICSGKPVPSGLESTPFMDGPTSCGPAKLTTTLLSYAEPEGGDTDVTPFPDFTGCESVPFEPTMSLEPTTRSAGAASGLDANLHIPQEGLTDPETLATAHLREAKVTLPQGFSLNASGADGLGSCTPGQIGLDRNERQTVDMNAHGAPASLSFEGHSTPVLPAMASAGEVQGALEALPNIGAGNVAVSGRPGGPWTVDFGGALAGRDVPAIGGTIRELQLLALKAEGGTY